jgi:hypothetical protein
VCGCSRLAGSSGVDNVDYGLFRIGLPHEVLRLLSRGVLEFRPGQQKSNIIFV